MSEGGEPCQVSGFLRIVRSPLPTKLTAIYVYACYKLKALKTITLTTFLCIFLSNSKYLIKYLISFYLFIQSKLT